MDDQDKDSTEGVPVLWMKLDPLFVVERFASLLDENRLTVVASAGILVELAIVHAGSRQNAAQVLRDAATIYKVDTDEIALRVKQEFTVKEKMQTAKKRANAASSLYSFRGACETRQAPLLRPSLPAPGVVASCRKRLHASHPTGSK
jgi:hypothetical protein